MHVHAAANGSASLSVVLSFTRLIVFSSCRYFDLDSVNVEDARASARARARARTPLSPVEFREISPFQVEARAALPFGSSSRDVGKQFAPPVA